MKDFVKTTIGVVFSLTATSETAKAQRKFKMKPQRHRGGTKGTENFRVNYEFH